MRLMWFPTHVILTSRHGTDRINISRETLSDAEATGSKRPARKNFRFSLSFHGFGSCINGRSGIYQAFLFSGRNYLILEGGRGV